MDATANPKRDWRRIVLPCSLLLNLFLVAVIGGRLLYGRAERLDGTGMLSRLQARAEAVLPSAEAQAFKAVITRDLPRFSPTWQQVGATRAELARQVAADPYDKIATGRALGAWITAWDGFAAEFGNTLVDALAQVSPEGRRKLIAGRLGKLPKEQEQ
ncbi:periplasmic heavy metal sensor [Desulfovibrio sp. TomC]|uniref:periplasmic heavy metal sensor n=1 Tax=Desulfovibrio sp. TomC TaxID=1562888 RepID=UPI0005756CBB|nr:periplasmic heavy metal sensor [Desulfovibrio sp. TomC]KHK00899.1 hypothetical protein NY78_3679 [Desulfovibrio sp. TomC]